MALTAYDGPVALNTSALSQDFLSGGIPVNMDGFTPSVTLTITWGTDVEAEDASSFPSGDDLKKINISIADKHGNQVLGAIDTAAGTATIATDSAKLVQTDTWTVKATVVTEKGCIGDGSIEINNAMTDGAVANWAISFTTSNPE